MKASAASKSATLFSAAGCIVSVAMGALLFATAHAGQDLPETTLVEEKEDAKATNENASADPSVLTVAEWVKYSNIFDLKPRSEAELQAETALRGPLMNIGFHFVDVPLSEVAEFIRETMNAEVQLDEAALNEIGLSPDTLVTAKIKGVRLDSALSLVLAPLDLTYVVSDEVILITSKEMAETIVDARVYPVDLILEQDAETIADLIQTTIASDTWVENGGKGGTISILSGRLVITQTYHVHRQITDLLCQLRTAKEKEAALEQEKSVSDESGSRYR